MLPEVLAQARRAPVAVLLLFVLAATSTSNATPSRGSDPPANESVVGPGTVEPTWGLLSIGDDFVLVAALGATDQATIVLRGRDGIVTGQWEGDPATSYLVCDACPGPVVAIDGRLHRRNEDGSWTVDRTGKVGPRASGGNDQLTAVDEGDRATLRAPGWPPEELLITEVVRQPNYRPHGGDPSVGRLGRAGDGTFIEVQSPGDPSLAGTVTVHELQRDGSRRSHHPEVPPSSGGLGCDAVGQARGVLLEDERTGEAVLHHFPRGFGGPHETTEAPGLMFNHCLVDEAGATLWIGVAMAPVLEDESSTSTEVVRLEGGQVAWQRSVPVETRTATVETTYDHVADVLVAIPLIGTTVSIDPRSGRWRPGPGVAAVSCAQSDGGTWWTLDFDGLAQAIPSLAVRP